MMTHREGRGIAALLTLMLVRPLALAAQGAEPIRDNSFLIEEAYNQEAGVVQHVSTFTRTLSGPAWAYAFTQEWPVRSVHHQLSYTIPVVAGSEAGLGDVAVHYRYQLTGAEGGRVAFAPRLSLLLATGDQAQGRGAGGTGVQANLPLSAVLAPRLILHTNVGATYIPTHADGAGGSVRTTALAAGASVIWLAHPRLNALIETLWGAEEETSGPGSSARRYSTVVAPGIRWAHDYASGLQIVPGVAYAIGVGPSVGDDALLVYLSLEHPFHR